MNIQTNAAKVITKVILNQKSLDEVLPFYLSKHSSALDQALLQELSYGTLRWYHRLDAIAKLLLHHTTKKIDPLVYSLILIGLYQLLYLRTPHYAALNETVAATRFIQKSWATSLVNGVLRNFLRQKTELLKKIEDNNIAQYSNPAWLIKSTPTNVAPKMARNFRGKQ